MHCRQQSAEAPTPQHHRTAPRTRKHQTGLKQSWQGIAPRSDSSKTAIEARYCSGMLLSRLMKISRASAQNIHKIRRPRARQHGGLSLQASFFSRIKSGPPLYCQPHDYLREAAMAATAAPLRTLSDAFQRKGCPMDMPSAAAGAAVSELSWPHRTPCMCDGQLQ